mmetsp:Transcript_71205/g.157180  ORF Transcript_71205/g.157180 Transcript_71205/m.157180 type:complete len:454 (-) Transcript_71205:35-1396(-)
MAAETSNAGISLPGSVDALKRLWDSEKSELERSRRVQQQLRAVLLPLQQRCEELTAENKRHVAEAEAAAAVVLAREAATKRVEAMQRDIEEATARKANIAMDIDEQLRAEDASRSREAKSREDLQALAEDTEDLLAALSRAEERGNHLSSQIRSMVSQEALAMAAAEAERLQTQLLNQEAEAARLRQALAESWAARAPGEQEVSEGVQEELEWLSQMQQDVQAEVRRLQQLERTEAALGSRLQQVSEEKAELKSARVDFEDSGSALREAIASQSEGYVRRIDHLELARRSADQDRVKLIQECADLQAQLDAMVPVLRNLSDLEHRHGALEAAQGALTTQSARLREMNAALGAQLLAEKGAVQEVEPTAESVIRALQLRLKLQERQEAQDAERQKLSEKIRALERGEPLRPEPGPGTGHGYGGSGAAGGAGAALKTATSALRGGIGRLRDGLKI